MTDRKDPLPGSGHTPPGRETNVPADRPPGAARRDRAQELERDPHVEDVDAWHHGTPPRR